jgi:hypothetical protein
MRTILTKRRYQRPGAAYPPERPNGLRLDQLGLRRQAREKRIEHRHSSGGTHDRQQGDEFSVGPHHGAFAGRPPLGRQLELERFGHGPGLCAIAEIERSPNLAEQR